MDIRTVKVIQRGPEPYQLRIATVRTPWVCLTCGGPRGEPVGHNFCENDDWYHCERWDNPCGHIDKYAAVLEQAQTWREAELDAAIGKRNDANWSAQ